MSDGLQEAILDTMSAMDDRMHLHMILQVDAVATIYGRLGGEDFYRAAIGVLERIRSKANALGLTNIAASHSARIVAAQSLLEKELRCVPIESFPASQDEGQIVVHSPEGSYTMLEDGSCYALLLNE